MKFCYSNEWLEKKIKEMDDAGIEEPGGLMACSPEIMRAAEDLTGRKWDGTQDDAEWLVREYMKWPGM